MRPKSLELGHGEKDLNYCTYRVSHPSGNRHGVCEGGCPIMACGVVVKGVRSHTHWVEDCRVAWGVCIRRKISELNRGTATRTLVPVISAGNLGPSRL